jgi:hypothetical protein
MSNFKTFMSITEDAIASEIISILKKTTSNLKLKILVKILMQVFH